jgi:tetratricopeptide (TPR) repeat protein/DNA-binding XRE family transcriptional regulator
VFGDVVRGHRRRLGLTQEELAAKAAVNVRSIGKIEAGLIAVPRPVTVRLLADAFGLSGPDRDRFCQAVVPGDPARADAGPTPAQLPADVAGFVGRADALRALTAASESPGAAGGPALVVAVVAGPAGVGKTALSVHWAHRIRDKFPDGQLYVNLRGFDPGKQIMDPAAAVRGFLDALEVPPQRIPADPDAQAALYRSLLADKRMLVVLDNARDTTQIRPLLPGGPHCLVVVTSRNRLIPLVAAHGAYPVTLDLLGHDEARELLARRLGDDRVAAEPDAVVEIAVACSGLPLALSIAAARAQQTGFPLTAVAAELSKAGQRLDALDAGDTTTDIRAVFSWSYTALTPPAAGLFRLLGLHPGPDISVPAAGSLTGHPASEVRRPLTELVHASLLTEHAPGRYTFHDLLRAYATDLTHTHDPGHTRRAATTRLLDHYTHTTHTAERLLHPTRDQIELPLAPPTRGAHPEHLADFREAMAWLTTEHPVLLAALRHAVDAGLDTHTWQMAWTLDTYLYRQGHWHDQAAAWQAALDAAHRLHDPTGQAVAHRLLAYANTVLGRYADAHTHHQQALELFARTCDPVGLAHTHLNLATLCGRQSCPQQALNHAQQSLAQFEAAGHRHGQARALNGVGWFHAVLGKHAQALTYCGQALALQQETGDRDGEADTSDCLGYAHQHLGHHTEAADCYEHALTLFRDLGDLHYEADTLTRLGDTHHAAGKPAAARTAWQQALTILTDLDHPAAGTVRTKLAANVAQEPSHD